jgi:hypothetical protein
VTGFGLAAALVVVVPAAVVVGCGRDERAEARPALELFRLAAGDGVSPPELAGVIGADLLEADMPLLLDALEELRRVSPPEVLAVETLPEVGRVAVDLRVGLPGEGSARYSVETARQPDGSWRVVGLRGPGLSWPARPRPRGEGLTPSPPPGA